MLYLVKLYIYNDDILSFAFSLLTSELDSYRKIEQISDNKEKHKQHSMLSFDLTRGEK